MSLGFEEELYLLAREYAQVQVYVKGDSYMKVDTQKLDLLLDFYKKAERLKESYATTK